MPDEIEIGIPLPGERLGIEIVKLIREIVEGQDPEVKKEISRMFLQDLKEWREFWRKA